MKFRFMLRALLKDIAVFQLIMFTAFVIFDRRAVTWNTMLTIFIIDIIFNVFMLAMTINARSLRVSVWNMFVAFYEWLHFYGVVVKTYWRMFNLYRLAVLIKYQDKDPAYMITARKKIKSLQLENIKLAKMANKVFKLHLHNNWQFLLFS